MHTRAVVVLGCQIRVRPLGADRELLGAAGRRAHAGARAATGAQPPILLVVTSGGRRWEGRLEADALARELVRQGVPAEAIVCERSSRNTRENAERTAALLRRHGVGHVVLVTCAWHMPRAAELFRRQGLHVEPFPAGTQDSPTLVRRVYRRAREAVAGQLDRLLS